MKKFGYAEYDTEFYRWTQNLFNRFIVSGEMVESENPDFLLTTSTALRINPEITRSGKPLVLVHNEAWSNYWPPIGADKFLAVVGCCPTSQKISNFIPFPYYAVHFRDNLDTLLLHRKRELVKPKKRFCCFVVSNNFVGQEDMVMKRIKLFHVLNCVGNVDSGGGVENNIGYRLPKAKLFEFVSQYQFMICLENTKANPGYLTEKPFTPWFCGTVPIYDGSAKHLLNSNAYIDASGELEDVAQAVIQANSEEMKHNSLVNDIRNLWSLDEFETRFKEMVLDK